MGIEIKLFGFGDDRPAGFDRHNRLQLDIETPATPVAVLRASGLDADSGLVLMDRDRVIPQRLWDQPILHDQGSLTLLAAFEGG